MEEFNFFFGFFGLLLGLSVAAMLTRLAEVISDRRKIGWLTGLLASFVLCDITSFYVWSWPNRADVVIDFPTLFGGLVIAGSYFIATTLVFPRVTSEEDLDKHYWLNKRFILAGIIFANALISAATLWNHPPIAGDWQFYFNQSLYWLPLIALPVSRSRRVDIALLVVLIGQYWVSVFGLLPESQWWATAVN